VQLDENDELIWDDGNPFPEPCIDDVAPMVGKVNLLLPWEDTLRKNIHALQMVFLLKKNTIIKKYWFAPFLEFRFISVSSRYTFVYQIWYFFYLLWSSCVWETENVRSGEGFRLM
jgi:hypothetical protein